MFCSQDNVNTPGKHNASPQRKRDTMGRPKKDGSAAKAKETNEEIASRVKKSGALSPALITALDEIVLQLVGLEEEYKKVRRQFKALTKV
jgi:hypothetical protein